MHRKIRSCFVHNKYQKNAQLEHNEKPTMEMVSKPKRTTKENTKNPVKQNGKRERKEKGWFTKESLGHGGDTGQSMELEAKRGSQRVNTQQGPHPHHFILLWLFWATWASSSRESRKSMAFCWRACIRAIVSPSMSFNCVEYSAKS